MLRTITPRIVPWATHFRVSSRWSSSTVKSFKKLTLPADDFARTKLIHGSSDLTIAITQRARDKLYTIANTDKNNDTALKISVELGGCHGFQYNLDLSTVSKEVAEDAEALVFKRNDGDSGEFGSAQLVLNPASLEILQELKIDYTKELIGSQFKVVDSPYTSTECGCGASFDFDFDKLEKAREERGQAWIPPHSIYIFIYFMYSVYKVS